MFQVYCGNIKTENNNRFKKKEDNGYNMCRRFQLYIIRSCKSEVGRNSLRYRGPLIWNSHPNDLKELENAQTCLACKKAWNIINEINFQKEAAVIINKKERFLYFETVSYYVLITYLIIHLFIIEL